MSTTLHEIDNLIRLLSPKPSNESSNKHSKIFTINCNANDHVHKTILFCKLIGKIWREYFKDNKCGSMNYEDSLEWDAILQYIIIIGGLPRDYLLGKKIKDIDINLDTHQLDILFYNHIHKYHSHNATKNHCFFFDLYNRQKRLNPALFIEILTKHATLKGKFKIKCITFPSISTRFREVEWYKMQITHDLWHDSTNLKDCIVEITDCSFTNMNDLTLFSNKPFPFNKAQTLMNDEYKALIWNLEFKNRWTGTDFTINSLFVLFSDVLKDDDIVIHSPHEIDRTLYRNCFQDIKNHVLNIPIQGDDACMYTMKCHYNMQRGYRHFWRLIKFMVKFDNKWTIDPQLFKSTVAFYDIWMNDITFTDINRITNLVWNIVDGSNDYNMKKFEAMNVLHFHQHLIPFYKKYTIFQKRLLKKIQSKSKEQSHVLMQLLERYEY
eukprot:547133_1